MHSAAPPEEALRAAAALKARGNDAFGRGDMVAALNAYNQSLALSRKHLGRAIAAPPAAAAAAPPAEALSAAAVLVRDAASNAAACWLRLGDAGGALAFAETALDADAGSAKAAERRATALGLLGLPRAAASVRASAGLPQQQAQQQQAAAAPATRLAACVALACGGEAPPPTWTHGSAVLRGRLYVCGGMATAADAPGRSLADCLARTRRAAEAGARMQVHSACVADVLRAAAATEQAEPARGSGAASVASAPVPVCWRAERVACGRASDAPPLSLGSFVCVADEDGGQLLLHGGSDTAALYNATWALRLDDDEGVVSSASASASSSSPPLLRWVALRTSGDAPPRCEGAAGALVGRTLYVHGGDAGAAGGGAHGEMHALDLDASASALTWRRVAPRSSAALAPLPRAFHTLTRLDATTLACFGGTDALTGGGGATFFADTLLFDVTTAKWRLPALSGSAPGALPVSGPKAGRAQHAAWAVSSSGSSGGSGGGCASLALFGGYAIGPRFFSDLRALDLRVGAWRLYDWAQQEQQTEGPPAEDAASAAAPPSSSHTRAAGSLLTVPRCRCGHTAAALDASGRVVAVWGGVADAARHELLVLTLRDAPATSSPSASAARVAPEAASARAQRLGPEACELLARLDALRALEQAAYEALRDERLGDAEVAARAWLAAYERDAEEAHAAPLAALAAAEAESPAARRAGTGLVLSSARVRHALGMACRHTGRLREAQAHYDEAIAAMERLAPPLGAAEAEQLSHFHFAAASVCRTVECADPARFLRHIRRGGRPGVSAAAWAAQHDMSDAALLRVYEVGRMDEAALRRERTQANALTGAHLGVTSINPKAWVLRACDGCGAREAAPGAHKRCAACGGALYCSKECQLAHWAAHKRACKAARAAKK
jgi:hypothetical protein